MSQKPRADGEIRTPDPFITSDVLASYRRVTLHHVGTRIQPFKPGFVDAIESAKDRLSLGVVS